MIRGDGPVHRGDDVASDVGTAEVDALIVDLDDDAVGDACQHVGPSDRAGEGVPVGAADSGDHTKVRWVRLEDRRYGRQPHRQWRDATGGDRPRQAVPTEVGHPRQGGIFEPRMTFERPAESHSRRIGRDAGEVECVRRADPRRARPVRVDDACGWTFVRGWDRWSVRAPSSSR